MALQTLRTLNPRPWQMAALAAALAAAGLAVLLAARQEPYTVMIDGVEHHIWTQASTAAGIARAAGVHLKPEDRVSPAREHNVNPGAVIHVKLATPVEIVTPQGTLQTASASLVPSNILTEAGIRLFPGDRLWVDGLLVADASFKLDDLPRRLRLDPASESEFTIDGKETLVRSAAPSMAQMLEELGVESFEADVFGQDPSLPWKRGQGVARSVPLQVQADGIVISARAVGPSVAEALAQAGLPLIGLDRAEPSGDSRLQAGDRLHLVRVKDQVLIEQSPIPNETDYQPDAEGLIDTQRVLDAGAFGIQASRVRIRTEDGAEVARIVEGEWVAREPEPRVLGYGTKIEIKTLDTEYGPLQYYRAVPMYATSYSPCRLGIPECDNITASGAILKKGIAAVLVRWYRYMKGAQVYVPGYGIATIADTGGGIPGRDWIDLGFEDHDYESWHDWVTVYFLTPVPANPLWVLN
jgi:uncharacterized protein YabE (DUF348 family)/3D (Asp-Asp-Asp) domain-containing protein